MRFAWLPLVLHAAYAGRVDRRVNCVGGGRCVVGACESKAGAEQHAVRQGEPAIACSLRRGSVVL